MTERGSLDCVPQTNSQLQGQALHHRPGRHRLQHVRHPLIGKSIASPASVHRSSFNDIIYLACVCDRPILTDGFSPSSLACEGQQWFGPCRSDLPQQNLNIRPGGRWSYTETSIRSQTIATVLQAPTWRSLIPSVSQQLDLAPGVDHVASLPSQILNLTVKISTELSKRGDNGRRERRVSW